MIDMEFVVQAILIPFMALLFPLLLVTREFIRNDKKIAIDKRMGLKFVSIALILSLVIFIVLIFLTGGINYYYFLERGIFLDERGLAWNITEHLAIFFSYNPGTSLLAISILSGVLYSSLLSFPAVCEIDTSTQNATETLRATTSSSVSSITASATAVASGTVCCSTSIVAIVAPTFSAVLAPWAPILIVVSLLILELTIWRYVIPRIPRKSKTTLIDFHEISDQE